MNLTVIGVNNEAFQKYLAGDPCFGKSYHKRADECKRCLAPVIVDGSLFTMREACEQMSTGAGTVVRAKHFTSQDVLSRIQAGRTVQELFIEALGDGDVEAVGSGVYRVLYARFKYLADKGIPVPALPSLAELKNAVSHNEAG